ncbi:MAG TPA: SulP family inorganic anion transporter, partial [Myxococcota bacterium]|nr:SulP family inorganic anion transporter [Myxococcota bacterium]
MGKPYRLRLDLGLRGLLPEWRELVSPEGLGGDLRAAVSVAAVSLPLSLAIAFASGVTPFAGLVSAVTAGVVCALFTGTTLSVSAPAMAMAILVASIDQAFGMAALLVVGLGAGLLQVLTGVLGFGRLWRYVPASVIAGFTAGIGALVLIGQIPSALGLAPPEQSHVVEVVTHISNLLHQTNPVDAQLSMATAALALVWPKYATRVPAPLVAVVAPTVAVFLLGVPVQTIGEPGFSLAVTWPSVRLQHWDDLLSACFLLYALASLETLLAAGGVAKIIGSQRHRPDQDLIGQGLGNMTAALLGGIPVTSVIARSALNVYSGAKTRRASILQALLIAGVAGFGGSLLAMIPTAVLAGLALSVALRMVHPREVRGLWATSRGEAVAYVVTFLAIVLVDLAVGVQTGMFAALAIVALRLARTRASVHTFEADSPVLLHLGGPLTFLAPLEGIRAELAQADLSKGLVIDLSGIENMDGPGAAQLRDIVETLRKRGVRVALQGASDANRELLLAEDPQGVLAATLATTLPEAHRLVRAAESHEHLALGVQRFRATLSTG